MKELQAEDAQGLLSSLLMEFPLREVRFALPAWVGALEESHWLPEHALGLARALGSQLRRLYTARMAIDSGKDKYWLMELWEMKSDYPAKLLLSAAKRTTADWCADAVKMCQTLDRRMKSEKGIDAAGELKLLLVRLGARRK